MAVEAKRGCGYRKIGGTYLEGDPGGFACGRFPLAIAPCPLCDHRPAFSRALQRITPKNILHASPVCAIGDEERCSGCPLNKALDVFQAGLMWVGGKFYTPDNFAAEATSMGVSKRISVVPKWFKVGQTWVFLAHEQAIIKPCEPCQGVGLITYTPETCPNRPCSLMCDHASPCEDCDGEGKLYTPAVFYAFVPRRIVRIVPDTMPEEEREELRKKGLSLVEVPHDDPDHQPSKKKEEEES